MHIICSVRLSVTFCTHRGNDNDGGKVRVQKGVHFLERKYEKVVGRPVCVWNIHNAGKPELEPLLGYGWNLKLTAMAK
jgi:hypothetical protein